MFWCASAETGEIGQTWSFRGSKSRNKVSVGEPAEGSLQIMVCLLAGRKLGQQRAYKVWALARELVTFTLVLFVIVIVTF